MSFSRFALLHLLFPFLICHVAADPVSEANRLMNLLKTAIELNNIHSMRAFISHDFTYDTCQSVLSYDQFLDTMTVLAAPPKAISTDWSTREAQLVDNVLHFRLHYNDQFPVAYADIQFEAKLNSNNIFIFSKGKSLACR